MNPSAAQATSTERFGEKKRSSEHAGTRNSSLRVALPRPLRGPMLGPSDAELERGILDAVRMGLPDVARTLSAQLEERRRARATNVIPLRREAT